MKQFLHGVVLFGAFPISWFLSFFCLLPFGLGAGIDADTGAPLQPRLGLKALVATAIAVALWLVFYELIRFKVWDL